MKTIDLMDAIGHAGDEKIMEVISHMEKTNYKSQRKGRKLFRTVLMAAVITALLGATAYAIVLSRMNARDVSGESIEGQWNQQHISYPDATLELSFDIGTEPCHKVEFRADYLPAEPENPLPASREGWYTSLHNWGDPSGELPYVIELSTGVILKDTRFYFNGDMEVVKEDRWKDWQRTEISGDYTKALPDVPVMRERNYLLLFSEEYGYLIKIASSQYGFDELEKIAENLEVEVLDTEAVLEWETPEVCCFDLGRG